MVRYWSVKSSKSLEWYDVGGELIGREEEEREGRELAVQKNMYPK